MMKLSLLRGSIAGYRGALVLLAGAMLSFPVQAGERNVARGELVLPTGHRADFATAEGTLLYLEYQSADRQFHHVYGLSFARADHHGVDGRWVWTLWRLKQGGHKSLATLERNQEDPTHESFGLTEIEWQPRVVEFRVENWDVELEANSQPLFSPGQTVDEIEDLRGEYGRAAHGTACAEAKPIWFACAQFIDFADGGFGEDEPAVMRPNPRGHVRPPIYDEDHPRRVPPEQRGGIK